MCQETLGIVSEWGKDSDTWGGSRSSEVGNQKIQQIKKSRNILDKIHDKILDKIHKKKSDKIQLIVQAFLRW